MSIQICYTAGSSAFLLGYPESAMARIIYERYSDSAAIIFGKETETDAAQYDVSPETLLRSIDEVSSGIKSTQLVLYSYQIVHEFWPGHPMNCKETGLFKLPGEKTWYSLNASELNKCILEEWVDNPEGTMVVKRRLDVSNKKEIETATKGYGVLKIKRKKHNTTLRKDLENLREFVVSVGENIVTVALC